MASENLLQAGIAAARAGDIAEASKQLIQVVKANPGSELGWFWLGLCRDVPKEREFCFRRVLEINPHNQEAIRQLDLLHQTKVYAPEQVPPAPVKESPGPVTSPSIDPVPNRSAMEQKSRESKPAKKSAHGKLRKGTSSKLLWIGLGILIFACFAAAGIFVLVRMMTPGSPVIAENLIPTAMPTTGLPTAVPNYQPVFQGTDCKFQLPEQSRVTCGFVVLPEDRNKDVADTIRVAVAVFHSTSSTPKPDPILYLQGGPGDEALTWSVSTYEEVIAPLLTERDFIVFDSRGVGYSEPALDCEEFSATYLQDLEGKIPSDQRASYYQGALLACKNNLLGAGANLSTYTSGATAQDARDVLIALGYQQANLYGISYGTRVAQLIMRDHPEVVRSAILDSVVPIETQLLSQGTAGQDSALQTLFSDCKADPICASTYPDLEATYKEMFTRLNEQPINVTVTVSEDRKLERVINGYSFQNTILWTLRIPQTIGLAPQLIYRTRDGDYNSLIGSLAFPVLAFDSISLGSYISINCHEQVYAMTLEKLDQTIFEMCELWGATPLLPGENDPVSSTTPTLIFAGRYDPTTPPAFAQQLAGHLSNSHIAEIPDQGHAPSASGLSDCPTELISAFLQDPNMAPDLTCVQETPAIKFVIPFDGKTPISLEPVTIEQYQVNTRIPAGWSPGNFGFYNRQGFWGDLTQIGIQQAPVTESQWVTWLETNFNGNKGFDQAAALYDRRQANGRSWSVYRTTMQGYPVDIAFAESNGQTLMVLMLSYNNEHDALYSNVFLQVLDATTAFR